jgi:hypothetical protein
MLKPDQFNIEYFEGVRGERFALDEPPSDFVAKLREITGWPDFTALQCVAKLEESPIIGAPPSWAPSDVWWFVMNEPWGVYDPVTGEQGWIKRYQPKDEMLDGEGDFVRGTAIMSPGVQSEVLERVRLVVQDMRAPGSRLSRIGRRIELQQRSVDRKLSELARAAALDVPADVRLAHADKLAVPAGTTREDRVQARKRLEERAQFYATKRSQLATALQSVPERRA